MSKAKIGSKKSTDRVKVETREKRSGSVVMEISFHFPGRRTSVKARSLAEAQKKIKKI